MADEKKPDAKAPVPAPAQTDPFVDIIWWLLILVVAVYIFNRLYLFISAILSGTTGGLTGANWTLAIHDFFVKLFSWSIYFQLISYILTVILVTIALFIYRNLAKLRHNEKKLFYPEAPTAASSSNPAWERILAHSESLNESDWRLCILEADIMLDDLLNKLSLPGDTISEKLKSVERSDFTTIDNAWEAHKIRNQIAHDGPTFMINQRETKRVIALYKEVFEEFHVI